MMKINQILLDLPEKKILKKDLDAIKILNKGYLRLYLSKPLKLEYRGYSWPQFFSWAPDRCPDPLERFPKPT